MEKKYSMEYRSNTLMQLTPNTEIIRELSYSELMEKDIAYKLLRETTVPGFMKVHLHDGYAILWYKDVIFHCIMWRILLAFDIDITTADIHKRIAFSAKNLAKLANRFVLVVRQKRPDVTRSQLNEVLFNCINYLYNFTCSELSEYAETISILGLVKIMHHPKVKKITNITYRKSLGTDVLERKLSDATKDLIDLLTDPDEMHPDDNELFYYLKTKQININQLSQMMIMHGPRTDVDDTLILHAVTGNTIDGLKTVEDVIVDSLSAKKTAFYMKVSVSDSQYMGRKQHILGSSLVRVYEGDCNTQVLLPIKVKENNYKSLIGVYMQQPNGTLSILTNDILPTLIGQTILVRNPITCACPTDGFCQKCGGELMFNIDTNINMGILSAIQFIDPTTQKILSAKHLVKTISLMYDLNPEAAKYFMRINSNEIAWNTRILNKLKHYRLGIFIKELGGLSDIAKLTIDNVNKIESYSSISKLLIQDTRNNDIIELDMTYQNMMPSLSLSMLVYIRDWLRENNPDGPIMWLPVEETSKFSILSTVVINDSMMKFVKSVNTFINKDIRNYTDVTLALEGFSDTIFSKVDYVHITHLSAILKLYLVTNEYDYRIPRVTDPAHVSFRTLPDIISKRSLGGQFAFENHRAFIYNPMSYILPRGGSVFDKFIGITDKGDNISKRIVQVPNEYLITPK